MDERAAAQALVEGHEELLLGGLEQDRAATARAGLLRWLEAWIADQAGGDEDAVRRLTETMIPAELEARFADRSPQERFAAAVTAYDRWRLGRLSEDAFARARAHAADAGASDAGAPDPDATEARRRAAEADLAELREIESHLAEVAPGLYEQASERLSESKLDCYYVLRGGGATSRRLARWLEREVPG